jgi:acetylornithine deacetylase/succinyl-diaminopimelate desuccinylase-like protein
MNPLRIDSIAAYPYRMPLKKPFRISVGEIAVKEGILFEGRSGDLVGWGEAAVDGVPFYASETVGSVMDVVRRVFGPLLRSRPWSHPEEVVAALDAYRGNRFAKAALLMLFACRRSESGGTLPLKILFSVGEEGLGNLAGMRQMLRDHPRSPRLLVSFDLSSAEYSTVAVGSKRYRVSVRGSGGHSWEDYGAPSATASLVDFLVRLTEAHRELAPGSKDPISFNIGSLRGGEGINCIAREAEAEFEFRSASPEALEEAGRIAGRLIEGRSAGGCAFSLDDIGYRPAGRAGRDTWFEKLLLEAWSSCGQKPRPVSRSTNINAPLARLWPAISVGLVRGGNIHREDEFLILDSLPEGWALLRALADRLEGIP